MKRHFIRFGLLLCACQWYASVFSAQIDHLYAQLDTAQDHRQRVQVMYMIGFMLKFEDYDSAMYYSQAALALATETGFQKGIAGAHGTIAVIETIHGDYVSALAHHDSALVVKRQIGDSVAVAKSYSNIANIYDDLGAYEKAIGYQMRALKIMELHDDTVGIGQSLMNIGVTYLKQQENDLAERYFRLALQRMAHTPDAPNVALIWQNLGVLAQDRDQLDSALHFYEKALLLHRGRNHVHSVAHCLQNIATVRMEREEFDAAIRYMNEARDILKEIDDVQGQLDHSLFMGEYFLRKKEYRRAIAPLRRVLVMADSLERPARKRDALDYLSQAWQALNMPDSAYVTRLAYEKVQNELFNEERARVMAELETRYRTQLKQDSIQLLTQENQLQDLQLNRSRTFSLLLIGIGVIVLLVLAIVLLLYSRHRSKTRRETAELAQKVLRAQMNPHFIFNSLNAIQSYIYENQAEEAGAYLGKFSRLIRMILENSYDEVISLDREVAFLNHYLELQQIRYENKFTYHVEIDPELDGEETMVPPMLAQPFIENAVEHAFRDLGHSGRIEVGIWKMKDGIRIEVKDNGIGIESGKKAQQERAHRSLAMKITRERLRILKSTHKLAVELLVRDLAKLNQGARGTEVTLALQGLSTQRPTN